MPALTKDEIKSFVRIELLKKDFKRRDDLANVIPGVLPEAMESFVDAFAEGLSNALVTWQGRQSVTILPPPGGAVIANLTTGVVAGITGPGSLAP